MANQRVKISQLTSKTTPVAADLLEIEDGATGASRKATRAAIVGATITGNGSINTGGYTLTVPTSGAAALRDAPNTFTADQTFSGLVNAQLLRPFGGNQKLSVFVDQTVNVGSAHKLRLTVNKSSGGATSYGGALLIVISLREGTSTYRCVVLLAYTTRYLNTFQYTNANLVGSPTVIEVVNTQTQLQLTYALGAGSSVNERYGSVMALGPTASAVSMSAEFVS